MSEGISTMIASPEKYEDRMTLIQKDVKSLLEGGPVLVSVERFKKRGTLSQNALFHELCGHIAKELNRRVPDVEVTQESVKDDMKFMFGLTQRVYSLASNSHRWHLVSWSQYKAEQRSDLITATLIWMGEHDIPDLPDLPASEYAQYREAAA